MSDAGQGDFFGGFDPRVFENVPLFRELAKVMAWRGGPVNWDLASQTGLAIAAPSGEGAADAEAAEEFERAVGAAELWLDEVTDLAPVPGPAGALSRAEWVRQACSGEGLGLYVEPLAEGMTAALSEHLGDMTGLFGQGMLPPTGETGGQEEAAGPMRQMMGALGAMLYGVQVGTIAGHLSGQLLATYELGVPTLEAHRVGVVGDAAARFAADYDLDPVELRYWLALREAGHRRQFAGVPWLREHLSGLVRRFAAEADLDPESLLEQFGGLSGLDPENPEALREALERPEAFSVQPTTAQQAVLDELQALVAFTLAWVDVVVRQAAGDRLGVLPRIEEAVRRRRAEKGQGERFLEQLVGLDLRPQEIRAAQAFCDVVLEARGQAGLDRVWRRAEHLPSPDELAEPSRWLVRMAAAELEDELDD